MGIFSKKVEPKKKATAKEEKIVAKAAPKVAIKSESKTNVKNGIIRNPRITEKAAHISDNRVYTFEVYPKATKSEIFDAIKAIYGVTPVKVNVTAIPTKRVFRRKSAGVKGGGRKAYVYLKKGDKIEFI